MKRPRYVPRRAPQGTPELFATAEDAWFWYITSQKARLDGARFIPDEGPVRPCDPDDLYRLANRLVQQRKITLTHLRVLFVYGFREAPPDPRDRQEETHARFWDEAMDRLTTLLIAKKIVECPEPLHQS